MSCGKPPLQQVPLWGWDVETVGTVFWNVTNDHVTGVANRRFPVSLRSFARVPMVTVTVWPGGKGVGWETVRLLPDQLNVHVDGFPPAVMLNAFCTEVWSIGSENSTTMFWFTAMSSAAETGMWLTTDGFVLSIAKLAFEASHPRRAVESTAHTRTRRKLLSMDGTGFQL